VVESGPVQVSARPELRFNRLALFQVIARGHPGSILENPVKCGFGIKTRIPRKSQDGVALVFIFAA
jgi:hypothetical protein